MHPVTKFIPHLDAVGFFDSEGSPRYPWGGSGRHLVLPPAEIGPVVSEPVEGVPAEIQGEKVPARESSKLPKIN